MFLAWRADIAYTHGSRCLQCARHISPSHPLHSHVSSAFPTLTSPPSLPNRSESAGLAHFRTSGEDFGYLADPTHSTSSFVTRPVSLLTQLGITTTCREYSTMKGVLGDSTFFDPSTMQRLPYIMDGTASTCRSIHEVDMDQHHGWSSVKAWHRNVTEVSAGCKQFMYPETERLVADIVFATR